jgi:hypothetical protein
LLAADDQHVAKPLELAPVARNQQFVLRQRLHNTAICGVFFIVGIPTRLAGKGQDKWSVGVVE